MIPPKNFMALGIIFGCQITLLWGAVDRKLSKLPISGLFSLYNLKKVKLWPWNWHALNYVPQSLPILKKVLTQGNSHHINDLFTIVHFPRYPSVGSPGIGLWYSKYEKRLHYTDGPIESYFHKTPMTLLTPPHQLPYPYYYLGKKYCNT